MILGILSATVPPLVGDGTEKVLKEEVKLEEGEVIDASCINKNKLCEFFEKEMVDCKVRRW